MAEIILVNNYYPLGYFSQVNLTDFADTKPEHFWSSQELFPPAEEWVEIDFDRERPLNFVDFEISNKPITIKIEFLNATTGEYEEIVPKDFIDPDFMIHYLPSDNNPWSYFEAHFSVVQTRKIKITFARREDPFPFPSSPQFPWSIDVRNLRAIHLIQTLDEFLEDTGVDILGNEYRTDLEVFDAENVLDFDEDTFWQSQPNPSRFAVEYLYFDMREGWRVGTMGWCNSQVLDSSDEIEGATMSDIELKFLDGVVIDEVYLDPVTFGPIMNIYYSLDDEADWDDKLWIPIPRQYTVKRGFHSLPSPTFVKFVKLEFTNLAAAPYNTLDYPDTKPIEYLKFPSWVRNYFLNIYPVTPDGPRTQENVEQITVNPTEIGFMNPKDRFSVAHKEMAQRPDSFEEANVEVKDFIDTTVSGVEITPTDSEIQFNPPTIFRGGLSRLIDTSRALGRWVSNFSELPWGEEIAPEPLPAPDMQSRHDMTEAHAALKYPAMYFPRAARHGYQIVEAIRPAKIAYFIALREISFHRRDFTVEFDEQFYAESLDDDDHVVVNEFELDNWRYVVTQYGGDEPAIAGF